MSPFPYRIERTRNRHSRAVLKDDVIVIRLGKWMTAAEEARHISILLERMSKAAARESLRTRIDPFRALLQEGGSTTIILSTGQSVQISVEEGGKTRAFKSQGGWRVVRGPKTDARTFHRFLWKLLAEAAEEELTRFVLAVNDETLRVPVRTVTLKLMRSRWGSCSHHGIIALSTPLLCTTLRILRYVVIHELSHIPHPDHSARFWATVEAHMPEYREELKNIKRYKLPQI